MSAIIIRGLDESFKENLKDQAKRNGRSMEAEARAILLEHVKPPHIGLAFIELGKEFGGIEGLDLERGNDVARAVDFE